MDQSIFHLDKAFNQNSVFNLIQIQVMPFLQHGGFLLYVVSLVPLSTITIPFQMCNTLLEYVWLSSIPRPLQNILPHQPELTKGIFHDYLTKRQLPEIGLLNSLLQFAAGIGFIRNMPPRLRNRQRFGSTRFTQAQANLGLGFFLPFSCFFKRISYSSVKDKCMESYFKMQ